MCPRVGIGGCEEIVSVFPQALKIIHKHLSELAFTQDPCSPEASHHRPTLAPPDTLGHAEQLLSNLKYGNHSMPTPGTAVAADPRLLAKVLSMLLDELRN